MGGYKPGLSLRVRAGIFREGKSREFQEGSELGLFGDLAPMGPIGAGTFRGGTKRRDFIGGEEPGLSGRVRAGSFMGGKSQDFHGWQEPGLSWGARARTFGRVVLRAWTFVGGKGWDFQGGKSRGFPVW